MGDIQWGKVTAFLYEHGYEGHLSIKPHGPICGGPPFTHGTLLLSKYLSR